MVQADLLSVSRAGLYYWPMSPSSEELAVKQRIDEIYTAWPFYGSRRIHEQLGREGPMVNRKAVQRHMQEMGLIALGRVQARADAAPSKRFTRICCAIYAAAGPTIFGASTSPQ